MEHTTSFSYAAIGLVPMLLAQVEDALPDGSTDTSGSGGGIAILLFLAIAYIFLSFCTWKIFQKCGTENAWFAWIPVLNTYVLFKSANDEQAVLWTVLSLIPIIGIVSSVMSIVAWVKVFNELGKSPWLLLLCLTGIGIFFVLGYAAFA
jgi:hypothetical protein